MYNIYILLINLLSHTNYVTRNPKLKKEEGRSCRETGREEGTETERYIEKVMFTKKDIRD